MGTVKLSTPYYVMITYVSFMIYLIHEDVLPGDSKRLRSLKPFLSRVILGREEDDDDGEELVWVREQTRAFLFS